MFVSMVVDSNKRFGAFTSLDDQRRVNVAASRARDQVWIFHSAALPEFNKDDIRRAWIEHASSGFTSGQQYDNLEDLCESGFEKDVLRQIVDRGYTPIPQFQVGKYRIDFVIALPNGGRIAIECDGDAYHQDLDADLARQSVLERVGRCEFFRVRGSVYGHDPIESLNPLWRLLEHRGARRWQEPIPTDDTDPSTPVTGQPMDDGTDDTYDAASAALLLADVSKSRKDSAGDPSPASNGETAPATDLPSVNTEQQAPVQAVRKLDATVNHESNRNREIVPPTSALHASDSTRGARGAILDAVRDILTRSGSETFMAQQVVDELERLGSPYAEGTVRTMISSHLCIQGYLVRVDRGLFRMR